MESTVKVGKSCAAVFSEHELAHEIDGDGQNQNAERKSDRNNIASLATVSRTVGGASDMQ
jgi:hypothetical protein